MNIITNMKVIINMNKTMNMKMIINNKMIINTKIKMILKTCQPSVRPLGSVLLRLLIPS